MSFLGDFANDQTVWRATENEVQVCSEGLLGHFTVSGQIIVVYSAIYEGLATLVSLEKHRRFRLRAQMYEHV